MVSVMSYKAPSRLSKTQQAALREWIESSITPMDLHQMSSFELKHKFHKTAAGFFLTDDQYIEAMLDCGYEIKSSIYGTNIRFKPAKKR
jgi:hypothetical protein